MGSLVGVVDRSTCDELNVQPGVEHGRKWFGLLIHLLDEIPWNVPSLGVDLFEFPERGVEGIVLGIDTVLAPVLVTNFPKYQLGAMNPQLWHLRSECNCSAVILLV